MDRAAANNEGHAPRKPCYDVTELLTAVPRRAIVAQSVESDP
jgi:hypothetical protein